MIRRPSRRLRKYTQNFRLSMETQKAEPQLQSCFSLYSSAYKPGSVPPCGFGDHLSLLSVTEKLRGFCPMPPLALARSGQADLSISDRVLHQVEFTANLRYRRSG